MSQHVPDQRSRIVAHAKLSSRSPPRQHDPVVEYQRKYPATTVILPPKLQSESCTSLVSAWDIEREEGEEEEVEIIDGADGWQEEAEEKRAPLAQFRRSYILSAHEQNYTLTPKTPPVTLSVSPYIVLYPKNPTFSKQNSAESSNRHSIECLKQSSTESYKPYSNVILKQNSSEYSKSYYRDQRDQHSFEIPKTYYSDRKLSDIQLKRHSSACSKQNSTEYPQKHSGDHNKQNPTDYPKQNSILYPKVNSIDYIRQISSDHPKTVYSECTKERSFENQTQILVKNERQGSSTNKKRHSTGNPKNITNGHTKRSSFQLTKQTSFEFPEKHPEYKKQSMPELGKQNSTESPKRNGRSPRRRQPNHNHQSLPGPSKNGNIYTNPLVADQIEPLLTGEASKANTPRKHKKSAKTPESNPDEIIQMSSISLHTLESKATSQESKDSSTKPYVKEKGGSQVPVAGGLFVATCIGSPVCVVAGLKLGMFAAIAGGIMGYTTGKMFADHEEKEAIAKGEFIFEDGKIPSDVKKKAILKRIHEWERFEANCHMLNDLEKEKKKLMEQLKRTKRRKSLGNSSKEQLDIIEGTKESRMRKAKSVGYPDQLSP